MAHLMAKLMLCLCLASTAIAFIPQAALPGRLRSSVRASASKRTFGLHNLKLTISEAPPATSVIADDADLAKSLATFLKRPATGKVGERKTVIITGASSGIGLEAARQLANDKGWFVIMAVRSYSKAAIAAKKANMDPSTYAIMTLDLASLQSVRDFVDAFKATGRTPDALVCNAAVWYPQDKAPRLTVEGYEESVGTNHLAHFLMAQLLVPFMPQGGRILFIGTETANDGLAGKVPPVADLGDLSGMEAGMSYTIDNKPFEPTKSYKESKVCNAITMREMNKRYGKTRGIIVNAMFPGCIAESPLFRQKRGWFRTIFPLFQKYITKQYVAETEAGRRVASCIADEELGVGGAYWKWNAKPGVDYERKISDENSTPAANTVRMPAEALDEYTAERVWDLSCLLTGVQVAPEIKISPAEAGKVLLEVTPALVRDDIQRADILLENLRALGDDITNPNVLTAEMTGKFAEEMDGVHRKAKQTLYYMGRRTLTPIITMNGDQESDPNLSIEVKSATPRWSLESAELLKRTLMERLPNVPTQNEDDQRSDCYGNGPSESPLMPQMFIRDLALQMEELNAPPPEPEGADKIFFGERDSLVRTLAVSISGGKIKP